MLEDIEREIAGRSADLVTGQPRGPSLEEFEKFRESVKRLLRGEVFLERSKKDHYGVPQLTNFAVSVCHTCTRPAGPLLNPP